MILHDLAQHRLLELPGETLMRTIRGFPGNLNLDHRPAASAHCVGDDEVQLDIGALQRLLTSLDMTVSS